MQRIRGNIQYTQMPLQQEEPPVNMRLPEMVPLAYGAGAASALRVSGAITTAPVPRRTLKQAREEHYRRLAVIVSKQWKMFVAEKKRRRQQHYQYQPAGQVLPNASRMPRESSLAIQALRKWRETAEREASLIDLGAAVLHLRAKRLFTQCLGAWHSAAMMHYSLRTHSLGRAFVRWRSRTRVSRRLSLDSTAATYLCSQRYSRSHLRKWQRVWKEKSAVQQIQHGKVARAKLSVLQRWRTLRRCILRSRALDTLERHYHGKQAIRAMALARASSPLSKWHQFCCYKKRIRDAGSGLALLCMANRRGSRLRAWKAALEIRSKYGQVERILCHRVEARLQVEAVGAWKQGLEKKRHLQWLQKVEKAENHRKMAVYENVISAWSRQCAIWKRKRMRIAIASRIWQARYRQTSFNSWAFRTETSHRLYRTLDEFMVYKQSIRIRTSFSIWLERLRLKMINQARDAVSSRHYTCKLLLQVILDWRSIAANMIHLRKLILGAEEFATKKLMQVYITRWTAYCNYREDREAKRQLAHNKWYHNALRKGVKSLRMYATTKSQKYEHNARLKRQWQKRRRSRAFAAWKDEAVEYIKMKRQRQQLAHDHYEMNILSRVHCDWRKYIDSRRSKWEEREDADALHRRATAKKLLAVLRAGVQRHKCEGQSLDERLVSFTESTRPKRLERAWKAYQLGFSISSRTTSRILAARRHYNFRLQVVGFAAFKHHREKHQALKHLAAQLKASIASRRRTQRWICWRSQHFKVIKSRRLSAQATAARTTSLSSRAMQGWMWYVRKRRAKAKEIRAAFAWRESELIRQGISMWIQVGLERSLIKSNEAMERQALNLKEAMRRVKPFALKWLSRVRQQRRHYDSSGAMMTWSDSLTLAPQLLHPQRSTVERLFSSVNGSGESSRGGVGTFSTQSSAQQHSHRHPESLSSHSSGGPPRPRRSRPKPRCIPDIVESLPAILSPG